MAHWQAWLLQQWQRPGPSAAAWLLRPLSWLYRGVVAARRAWFARWPGASWHAPVPVVVVGNLVAGGAGKTPAVIALVAMLRAQGWTPGVVSRGYGRRSTTPHLLGPASTAAEAGDEPLLIHRRATVPVAVAADRVAAAQTLLAANPQVDVIVADDGLQHLRLARDLDIIVFDDRGVGNGLCLPAGPLREPMPVAPPSRSIVLYSGGAKSTAWPGHLGRRRLGAVVPLQAWWAGVDADAGGDAWATLRGRPVTAAAGLARPQGFFAMLREQGLNVTPCPLPDHADFSHLPWPANAADVVVTEKDAVKLRPGHGGVARVWVVRLDFELPPSFGEDLRQRLPTRAKPT